MRNNNQITDGMLLPPSSASVERKVIASAIIDEDFLPVITAKIQPEHFVEKPARALWELILSRKLEHMDVSVDTLLPIAPDRAYYLQNIIPQITELSCKGVDASVVNDYVETLVSVHEKINLWEMCRDILAGIPTGQSCGELREVINRKREEMDRLKPSTFRTAIDSYNTLMDTLQNHNPVTILTGIASVDEMLHGGFKDGTLNILSARPSVGKTTLALQFCQIASARGIPSAVFSLEMTEGELTKRLLTQTGLVVGVDFEPPVAGEAFPIQRMEEASQKVINGNLYIDDSSYTLSRILTRAEQLVTRAGVKFIMIDYLGLIQMPESRESTAYRIGEVTRRLKIFAKTHGVAILLLCQLSRDSARENRPPQMYDLRDSGSIEQDADIVIMLDRTRDMRGNPVEGELDLYIRKHRAGRCTMDEPFHLYGSDTHQSFTDIAPAKPSAPAEPKWGDIPANGGFEGGDPFPF